MIEDSTLQALVELNELIEPDKGGITELSEWDKLDPRLNAVIPAWYKEALSRFRLGGIVLDVDTEAAQLAELVLTTPDLISGPIHELWSFVYLETLLGSPYFPIAWNANGEVFVAEKSGGSVGMLEPTSRGPDSMGTQILVAQLAASSPQWNSVTSFISDLIPEDYEG